MKAGIKVDIANYDFKKEREKITDIPGLIEFAHTVGSALIKPEDKGKIKGQSLAAMREQTGKDYSKIMNQMKGLLQEAQDLKTRVSVSERIYNSNLSFKPVIHQTYHLYEREDSSDFLSMISPDEWGNSSKKLSHIATVKLMSDYTWEVIEGSLND